MATLNGQVTHLLIYEEEGGRDLVLSISKLLWYAICLVLPFSFFRFLRDLFGPWQSVLALLALAMLVRFFGPANLVYLDELLCRLFPSLRSAVRLGRVRIYDFRLRTSENKEVACILKGDLSGAAPILGDVLTLEGHNRWGTFRVQRGVNERTGNVLTPRSLRSWWLLIVTAWFLGFFIAYLSGALDELIYGWLERFFESQT
jgi:hypothetical protein